MEDDVFGAELALVDAFIGIVIGTNRGAFQRDADEGARVRGNSSTLRREG